MRCNRCRRDLPLEDFPRNKNGPSGRHWNCKPCHNEQTRESRKRLHGSSRNYLTKHRYGIDETAAGELLNEQGGLCPICQSAWAVHIDHDHLSGRVRGIVCFTCNGALGKFQDDVV